jgi:hypothetical protein
MSHFTLKNEQTTPIDLGNSSGLTLLNLSSKTTNAYVDQRLPNGQWSAVTGTIAIPPHGMWMRTRIQLGVEHVRVGARGADDGTNILEGTY